MQLRAILFERDPGYWVGQYLEHDIGAQATNLGDLLYNMQRSLVGHLAICAERGVKPFSGLASTPYEYEEMWDRAKAKVEILKPDNEKSFVLPEEFPELEFKAA